MKEEIKKVVDLQEELDIDVLVHGEPEVSFFLLILYVNLLNSRSRVMSIQSYHW